MTAQTNASPLPLAPGTLAIRYVVFAAVATLVNIATQAASVLIYAGSWELPVAMAAGTGTGLLAKYVLDKRFIFYDATGSVRAESAKFTLYTAMGVVTTLIFWGTEALFDHLGGGDHRARYAGAAIGLAIGYVVKYRLDRRFVFRRGAEAVLP